MRPALREEDALGRNCSLPEDAPDGFLKSCIWLSSRMGMMKTWEEFTLKRRCQGPEWCWFQHLAKLNGFLIRFRRNYSDPELCFKSSTWSI